MITLANVDHFLTVNSQGTVEEARIITATSSQICCCTTLWKVLTIIIYTEKLI